MNQVEEGTGKDSRQKGEDRGKRKACDDNPSGDLPTKKRELSPIPSWKSAASTLPLHTAFVSAMETLGGSATSVSVNRAEDEGKTNAASPKTPKRRLLDDIQGMHHTIKG